MIEDPEDNAVEGGLWAEATDWFGKMRGPEAEKHRPGFEAWLARGALHRSFFNRAGEVWAEGKFLRDEAEARKKEERRRDHAQEALDRTSSARRSYGTIWRKRAIPLAIVIAVVILLVSHVTRPAPPEPRTTAVSPRPEAPSVRLATPEGHFLTQILPDGSKVRLEPKTSLLVTFTPTRRALRLERGKSRFEVAHEPRPFVVFAGNGSITARGTIFEVAVKDDERVNVRLIRGKVDVATTTPSNRPVPVRHMIAGEELTYSARDRVTVSPPGFAQSDASPLPATTLAPEIQEFRETRLAEVVAAASKLGRPEIQLADPDLGSLKVSGRLDVGDHEKLAAKLALILNLTVARSPSGEIILDRR